MEPQINNTTTPVTPKKPFPWVAFTIPLAFLIGAISFASLAYFSPETLIASGILKKDYSQDTKKTESEKLIENTDSKGDKEDSRKFVTVTGKTLKISFEVPQEDVYVEQSISEELGDYIRVSIGLPDSTGNAETIFHELVVFSRKTFSGYTYEEASIATEDSEAEIKKVSIMNKPYSVKWWMFGEGNPFGGFRHADYFVDVSDNLHVHVRTIFTNETVYEDQETYTGDYKVLREYKTSQENIDLAVKIVESLRILEE